MSKNRTYRRLIHTARWLRLRRDILSAHPVCQACEEEGRLSPATEVHHIVPCETALGEREMEALMYDPHNLVALCHRCHVEAHVALGRGGKEAARRRAGVKMQKFVKKFLQK